MRWLGAGIGLFVVLFVTACGGGFDTPKAEEVKAYMRKVAAAQSKAMEVNETYALDMRELIAIDGSLAKAPEGYTFDTSTVMMSFGWSATATPEGSGPSFFIDDSGVLRGSSSGVADESSPAIE